MPQSDPSREGGAAPGDGSTPPPPPPAAPAAPPADPRPKPQYGEYAPEGWSWQPPEQAMHDDPPKRDVAPPPPPAPQSGAAAAAPARRERAWDRPVTLGLLVFGIIGASIAVSIQQTLPDAMSLLHTQEGLDPYVQAEAVAGILSTGMWTQVLLWLLTAALAIVRLVRRRLAFWVPLAGGALSFLVLFGVIWAVLVTDPVLVEHFGTVGTAGIGG
ncbi:hypothetical protein ARHIZOSPH14_25790 [Agromyces rhizosphaerae]|uniref:Uncharacterized protein n=1 Tax=Agromyces rhizosphaerae TaxID=88374 RepID=A0A9W6FS42_9MICO|nr:DUF6264 family protein [Agromyces rhizosphaerae]GLI28337.1 hypothetical protein ARHIZOSPH14_25790 [Agromyces rhizosphaerae]